jgi:lantibiotic modifying enzyme
VDGKLALIYRAYGPDVYAGTSGIALFLGQLHRLTGERLFRVTAEGALQQSLSRWDAIRRRDRVGFFSGLTGIAYVASRLGELFGQEHYMQSAELLIEELARSDVSVAGVDVINGCAGAIPALIDLHARGRHDANLDLAVRFGDYVIEKARKRYSGWSWETTDVPVFHNLTGFGHGAGGIGSSLLE